jgi:hypothetical protein
MPEAEAASLSCLAELAQVAALPTASATTAHAQPEVEPDTLS